MTTKKEIDWMDLFTLNKEVKDHLHFYYKRKFRWVACY